MIVGRDHHHVYKAFVACAGLGFLSRGLQLAHARVGTATAGLRLVGAVDVDPIACADHERITGVRCTPLDLFSIEQYIAFHGRSPPPSWREATPEDIRRSAGGEHPDIVAWSPPCKGLSSLLNTVAAASARYQALNRLVLRTLELMLDAFERDPPALFLLENVPRIQTRGRELLDQVKLRLELAGYACAETVHECGELGGLAQRRQRFLLVARHRAKVRPFLYEPDRKPIRGVGEVVGRLPMPDDPAGGPMHRLPRLQWRTWVRLALIEAGSDWRSLNRLDVVDGVVRDLRIVPDGPEWHRGVLGVRGWDRPAVTVTGESLPFNGSFSVADPRPHSMGEHSGKMRVEPWGKPGHTVTGSDRVGSGMLSVADPRAPRDLGRYEPYGVVDWAEPGHTVTGQAAPGTGAYSVADPRCAGGWEGKGKYSPAAWDRPSPAVIAGSTTGQGAFVVADPRLPTRFNDVYRVVHWDAAAQAVTTGGQPSAGGQAIADPRVCSKTETGAFASARYYGILAWNETSPTITGSACHDNGAHSVADPRPPTERGNWWIWSTDGTRHRPFSTLELAALQGYPVEEILGLQLGGSDSQIREHIGNAVPLTTAQAIGSTMLGTLLLAELGQGFQLSTAPIWVDRRLALASVMP